MMPSLKVELMQAEPITAGQQLPEAQVTLHGEDVNIRDYFKDRTGVIFGVPGAFTPTCTERHLPSFRDHAAELKNRVSFLGCVCVNDPFVVKSWAKECGVTDEMTFIADFKAELVRCLGLAVDMSQHGLGIRSRRFAMIVSNSTVSWVGFDEDAYAEVVLAVLERTTPAALRTTDLISAAVEAYDNAYAPYSKKPSSCAVQTEKGIFTGASLENGAYPNSICGIKAALYNAVSEGSTRVEGMAFVGFRDGEFASPCGSCRELMLEFGNFPVLCVKRSDRDYRSVQSAELLPNSRITSAFAHNKREVFTLDVDFKPDPKLSLTTEEETLCKEAIAACVNAYAPVSNFPVGAALLTDKGIVRGSNVECSVLSCGTCAERAGMCKAIAKGAKTMRAIAVCCYKVKGDYGRPCGGCRQNLVEFGKYPVLMLSLDHESKTFDVDMKSTLDITPGAFMPDWQDKV